MPDRAKCVARSLCEACAAVEHPPCLSPLSHLELCCIHMFSRERLPANLAESGACNQQALRNGCAGLCENCPVRLKSPQIQTNPQLPAAPISTPLSDEEITRVTAPADVPYVEGVRLRPGQKKWHVERRPPRFQKKLWFGSYSPESLNRACDAMKFYTGCKKGQYLLLDSEETFANYPLNINFKDLDPLCNNHIFVGSQRVKAHKYFGQEVRRVIKKVLEQDKKIAADERKFVSQKMPVWQHSPNPVDLPTLSAPLMIPAPIEDADSSASPSSSSWSHNSGESLASTLLASTSSGLPATPFFCTNAASGDIMSSNVLGATEHAHVAGFELKVGDAKDMPGEECDAAINYSGATACSVDDLLLYWEPGDFGGGPSVPLTDEDLDPTFHYLLMWPGVTSEECRGIHTIRDYLSLTGAGRVADISEITEAAQSVSI